jgi:hypothetical protein
VLLQQLQQLASRPSTQPQEGDRTMAWLLESMGRRVVDLHSLMRRRDAETWVPARLPCSPAPRRAAPRRAAPQQQPGACWPGPCVRCLRAPRRVQPRLCSAAGAARTHASLRRHCRVRQLRPAVLVLMLPPRPPAVCHRTELGAALVRRDSWLIYVASSLQPIFHHIALLVQHIARVGTRPAAMAQLCRADPAVGKAAGGSGGVARSCCLRSAPVALGCWALAVPPAHAPPWRWCRSRTICQSPGRAAGSSWMWRAVCPPQTA